MSRAISLPADVSSLWKTISLQRRIQPDIVSAGTPKAGLLGTMAAFITRTPKRVYLMRGLRLETESGTRRAVLWLCEWLSCLLATDVIAISHSLRDTAIRHRLVRHDKISVLGDGSSNGIDIARFKHAAGTQLGWRTKRSPILGYVGRITPDKGVHLLPPMLDILTHRGITGTFLLVGEDDDSSAQDIRTMFRATAWDVIETGHVDKVETIYPDLDVLCFPSLREGFGNVILEAAAAGVPTVAAVATGVVDAIVDGVTGVLVDQRTPSDLANAVEHLIAGDTGSQMGAAAQKRVEQSFEQNLVWTNHEKYYRSLFEGGR